MAAAATFEAHGLVARPYAGEGMRVTIAQAEADDRVLSSGTEHRRSAADGLPGDADAAGRP
ncbi:hypothetical protein ABZ464_37665 [Streptomyces sp. NPDC005820]|uniref:hypothetical protein n=1 Tax=Streptomyces sp. NPDC005820 TaxID=3157069 RepID=UPI0033EA46B9